MLQRADILLLDEPTNHLDVINVAWVKNYINSLTNVTAIMVSHDKGFLNDCCTDILSINRLKLKCQKGNLDAFVKTNPEANSFFDIKQSKLKFTFPQPGPIEGVKSKSKALMKMAHADFTYPGNEKPTLFDISIQVGYTIFNPSPIPNPNLNPNPNPTPPGIDAFSRGLRRRERCWQVDHDQSAHRRGGAAGG